MYRFVRTMAVAGCGLGCLLAAICARAQVSNDGGSLKRARTPSWTRADAEGVFFQDAFADALQGSRPAHLSPTSQTDTASERPPVGHGNTAKNEAPDGNSRWSRFISRETIEDEVKSLAQRLNQTVTTPGKFAAGGYQEARVQFSTLAMLFGIIAEYDGDVRWKADAAAARDRFVHASSVAKVGTIQVYNAAKARKTDISDLVRGGDLGGQQSASRGLWTEQLDRSPLMTRLEIGMENTVVPAMADAQRFRAARATLIHEAEIIAAIGAIMHHEGMEDSADDEYAAFCRQLEEAAARFVVGAKQENYATARQAANDISTSCSNCHEDYR